MATNKLGDGTVNVGVNVTTDLRDELKRLARASKMSLSKYCRSVLEGAAARNLKLEQRVVECAEPQDGRRQSPTQ